MWIINTRKIIPNTEFLIEEIGFASVTWIEWKLNKEEEEEQLALKIRDFGKTLTKQLRKFNNVDIKDSNQSFKILFLQ